MTKIPVNLLKVDHAVFPRMRIDFDHVQRLIDAIDAGIELPPVIVCKSSRRIVDGTHRTKAFERKYGTRAQIPCIEKEYANDQELFLDAVRYNADHGLTLTSGDRSRAMEIANELKIDPKLTATVLRLSVKKSGGPLGADRCGIGGGLRTVSPARMPRNDITPRRESAPPLPLNEAFQKRVGQTHIPKSARGDWMNLVSGLINLLENRELDVRDHELMSNLERLSEILNGLELGAAA